MDKFTQSIDDIFRKNDIINKIATMQTHAIDGAYLNQPGKIHVMLNVNDLKYSGRKINYESAEDFARRYLMNPIEDFELKIAQALGDNYKKAPKAIKMIFERKNDRYDCDAALGIGHPSYVAAKHGAYV